MFLTALVVEAAPEDVNEKGFAVAALRAADLHGAASRWPVDEDGGRTLSPDTARRPLPARLSLSSASGRQRGAGNGLRWLAEGRTQVGRPERSARKDDV